MWPKPQAIGETSTDSVNLLRAHHVSLFLAEESQHTRRGDYSNPLFSWKTDKDIAGKQRALHTHCPVCPSSAIGVQRQKMLH
jgi:hypothetical protein